MAFRFAFTAKRPTWWTCQKFNYLYDGLYRIAKYWPALGIDGFKIWRFRMEKLPYLEDDLPPESGAYVEPSTIKTPSGNETSIGQQSTVNRVVRSTKVGNWVKKLHDFTC
jgi:putative restriction endonuclease